LEGAARYLAICKTYQNIKELPDMILISGMVICGGPFKVLRIEEVHNTWGTAGNFSGRKTLIWFG
jgi:hypothetical protein